MDWYPHHIDDYDADTLHLTPAEDGIYSRLLRWYYKHERPLPDDDVALAAISRIGLEEWRAVAPKIRALFVTARHVDWSTPPSPDPDIDWVKLREVVLSRDGEVCAYCGADGGPFDIDHVRPRSRGGTNAPNNLVVACQACNRSKGARTLEEWRS